jgi:hypothetical protein
MTRVFKSHRTYHDLEKQIQRISRSFESNATILQLSESLAVTEIRLGEVSGTLNSTIGAYRGSASLEVPVVIRKPSLVFLMRRLVA